MKGQLFKVSRAVLTAVFMTVLAFSAYAGDGFVIVLIDGTNVNVRPSADTKGAAIWQCNTGDVFMAYDKLVRGSDGKLWYKLAASVNGDKKIVTAISHDPRFKGASDAYISAQFVSVTETLDSEGSAEFESLLAASKPVTTKPAASARFFPVVIDGSFIGGCQNGKWVSLHELVFTVKGEKINFVDLVGAITGDGIDSDFEDLKKGAKLTACISGIKKATITLEDKPVWVSFMGAAGVVLGKPKGLDPEEPLFCIDGTLPGADAPTVFRKGDIEVIAYEVEGDGDTYVELTRNPDGDGVSEIGAETPYANYKATVHYGGKSHRLDGDLSDGINFFPDEGIFRAAFMDVNGDGQPELALHCNSATRGAWVYELGKDGPKEVLGCGITNAD